MSIKITIPNSSSDVLTFGSGNTPTAAQIAGIDSGSSNGQLALYTTASGTSTERVRVDSSGNVGIGTNAPSVSLHVSNATDNVAKIRLSRGTSSQNYLQLQMNGGDSVIVASGITGTNGSLLFGRDANTGTFTESARFDSSGGLILVGSTAQKATGTTWSNPSDQRLKDNIRDYAKGTTELMQVRVREWEYNGKGGTTEGMKGLGVIADEVMTVLPNTVENYDAKLNVDDEETTAIKKFDATEITWLLVKTVQEQQAIITSLTDRITALEGAK